MNKFERKNLAVKHFEEMEDMYFYETKDSIENSSVYRDSINLPENKNGKIPFMCVEDLTSEKAAYKYSGPKTCLLNFASFKWPGGGFINGSMAQEEAICHASNLYNIIGDSKFAVEYEWNRSHLNGNLYSNFAIYSPDVRFPYGQTDDKSVNVITCAAPNVSASSEGKKMSGKTVINMCMASRIKFILDLAELKGQKTLILGAFGCGVFGNDPMMVAETFKKFLNSGNYSFDTVSFAIPVGPNFDSFKKVFE